jgi:tetratricopeptide (TPR) repeat protein
VTETPPPAPESRPSLSLILAVGFLVISLAVAGLILSGAFNPTPEEDLQSLLPTATSTPIPPTATPVPSATPTVVQTATPPPPPTPTLLPTEIVIGVARLGPGDNAATDQLVQALNTAYKTTTLGLPLRAEQVALPETVQTASEIDPSQVAVGADLLIVWEDIDGGVRRFTLLTSPIAPPLPQVDSTPEPWALSAPGSQPVFTAGDDLSFPAGLAVGLVEAARGQPSQAFQRFQDLQGRLPRVSGDPASSNQAVLSFAQGFAQSRAGNVIDALRAYTDALRQEDRFAAAYVGRGNAYLTSGDTSAALAAYGDALNTGPAQAAAAENRVLALLAQADLDTAMAAAQELVVASRSAWSVDLRGLIAYQKGDYQNALTDFELAAQLAPGDPIPLFNQALALTQQGESGQALVVLDALAELQPQNPVVHLYLGDAFAAAGQPDQAVSAYSDALALDPSYLDAYLQRGRVRITSGNFAGALDDANLALGLDATSGAAYWLKGDALIGQEDFSGAEDAYSAALANGQSGPAIFAGRAWALQRQGFSTGALQDYQQAIQLGESDPQVLYRYGFALYNTGHYEDALTIMTEAVQGGLDTAEGYAGLALALDANIQRSEAEQQYAKALQLDKRYGDANFLGEQPLWSRSAVTRAVTILRRLGVDPYSGGG